MRSIIGDLDVDSYKLSHFLQNHSSITNISSYVAPRSGPDEIVFFGLQMWLKGVLDTPVTQFEVDSLRDYAAGHGLPFNEQFTELAGKPLPLRIQALPEGTIVRPGTCLVQVTNTDPRYPWLTSFVETSMLRAVWYPTTVATRSRRIKRVIKHYLQKTADSTAGLPFKLHDFGFRGVSSYESGCIGGLAHLVNFMGTDTMGALRYAREFYHEPMAGFSIPASEHSTITSWDSELDAFRNMIDQFGYKPGALFACVSDSNDIYAACERLWGTELRSEVMDNGATLVVRPDSGDPLTVVLRVLEILGEKFGTRNNSKGFRVLPDYVRVIQGDGVNESSISTILGKMLVHGWSADNIAFGMGGALLQQLDRDTLSFAMKASAKSTDGGKTWTGFSKNPATMASKRSKAGRLAVIRHSGDLPLETVEERLLHPQMVNELRTVWQDGKLLVDQTLTEIRQRAEVED